MRFFRTPMDMLRVLLQAFTADEPVPQGIRPAIRYLRYSTLYQRSRCSAMEGTVPTLWSRVGTFLPLCGSRRSFSRNARRQVGGSNHWNHRRFLFYSSSR